MGGAIARGILSGELSREYSVTLADPMATTLSAIKSEYPAVNVTSCNTEAVKDADVVILAVKPWLVPTVTGQIACGIDFGKSAVASLAAGVSCDSLCEMLGSASRQSLCRVMPNTAISVGQSMTFICGDDADRDKVAEVEKIFSSLGKAVLIPERMMTAAMALCSCGIAYAMRYVRAATEGGVELGLYAADAKDYVLQTLRGAVALLEASGIHPEAEIDRVTTPGGVTIKGLNAMEKNGFTNAVIEGLKASAQ